LRKFADYEDVVFDHSRQEHTHFNLYSTRSNLGSRKRLITFSLAENFTNFVVGSPKSWDALTAAPAA
jgi:hypothetical protein